MLGCNTLRENGTHFKSRDCCVFHKVLVYSASRLSMKTELLYAAGRELANAYSELTDPLEQRSRLEAQVATHSAARERMAANGSGVDEEADFDVRPLCLHQENKIGGETLLVLLVYTSVKT